MKNADDAQCSPVACEHEHMFVPSSKNNENTKPTGVVNILFKSLSLCRNLARRDEELDEIRIDRRLLLEPLVGAGWRQPIDIWSLLHFQIAHL